MERPPSPFNGFLSPRGIPLRTLAELIGGTPTLLKKNLTLQFERPNKKKSVPSPVKRTIWNVSGRESTVSFAAFRASPEKEMAGVRLAFPASDDKIKKNDGPLGFFRPQKGCTASEKKMQNFKLTNL
jgi:hypothetical protein